MKNLLLVLAMLFSASAFAKTSKQDLKLTSDWQSIGSININTTNATYTKKRAYKPTHGSCESRVALVKDAMSSPTIDGFGHAWYKDRQWRRFYNSSEPLSTEKIEAGCSEVTFAISEYFGDRMGWTHIEVFCKPRPFSQTIILSLYKTCMKEPVDKCFEPHIIKQLDEVKPTLYHNKWISKCLGSIS